VVTEHDPRRAGVARANGENHLSEVMAQPAVDTPDDPKVDEGETLSGMTRMLRGGGGVEQP
jgi:hypothetical protein